MAHYFTQDIGSRPGRLSSEQDIDHAIAIYIRFISLQATNPIGLSHKKRQEVELRLSHSPGPRWDTFVQASEDVLIALEHVRNMQTDILLHIPFCILLHEMTKAC